MEKTENDGLTSPLILWKLQMLTTKRKTKEKVNTEKTAGKRKVEK
jgi:hypothetical protein